MACFSIAPVFWTFYIQICSNDRSPDDNKGGTKLAKSNASAAVKSKRSNNPGGNKKSNNFKPRSSGNSMPAMTASDSISSYRGQKFNPWMCVLAFAIPFLLTLIAYIGYDVYPFGKRSVLTLDLNGQYIYYFEGIRDAFWGDGSLFYNWSRNLSGGFMGIIGYYLASPFTLIPILMPREHILEAIMLMQMCKVGSCGFTFCIYAQKSKKLAPGPSLICSVMYAMMAFVVIQLIDPMWIDGPILLPLIILGIEHLVDDGRKLGYIIPTALMFIANFYIGFMIAIFIAIYYLYYLMFGTQRKFKGFKDYAVTTGIMALSTIVVLMCSAIMILPVYHALQLGKFDFSEPRYDWSRRLFKLPELIPTLLPNQYYSVNVDQGTRFYGRPEIYCGVLTFVLAPLYFFNKNIKWNRKVGHGLLLTIMVTSMYVKPLNMYWHGGQDPNWLPYRFSFIISFILVSMAAEVFANLDGLRLSKDSILSEFGKYSSPIVYGTGIFSFIGILILCSATVSSKYNYNESKFQYPAKGLFYKNDMNFGKDYWTEIWLGTLGFGALLAAVYIILIFIFSSTKSKNLRSFLLVATACVVCFEGGYNCYDSFRKIYKEVGNSCYNSYAEITSAPDDITATLEDYDGSFYRAEKTYNRMVNDNMAYGLKGISHSSSVMNSKAIQALEHLGYFTQSFESKYEGNNPVSDSLLGVKYVLDDPSRRSVTKKLLDSSYQKVLENIEYKRYDEPNLRVITSTVDVYENPNALSIGWMSDKSILDVPYLDQTNPFHAINQFLGTMVGNKDAQYYKDIPTEVVYDDKNVKFHDYPDETGCVHDCYESYPTTGYGNAYVNVRFTAPVDGIVYMHLSTYSKLRKACYVWVGVKDTDGEYKGSKSSNYDSYATYFENNSDPIVRLGPFKKGQEVETRFTIKGNGEEEKYTGKNEYLMVRKDDGFHFSYLDSEAFQKDIDILKKNQWHIDMDKTNDRHLEGTIVTNKDQVFITSIPYEPGWTIEVDGKKYDDLVKYEGEGKEQRLVNKSGDEGQVALADAFIGIKFDDLEPGEHTISMTYTPPGFNTGVVALVFGIIALFIIYFYDKTHNPVVLANLEEKKRRKLGIKETPDTETAPKKKNVQIIKSKGEVSEAGTEIKLETAEKVSDNSESVQAKEQPESSAAPETKEAEQKKPEVKAKTEKNTSGNGSKKKKKKR